jgi:hypothetical protein
MLASTTSVASFDTRVLPRRAVPKKGSTDDVRAYLRKQQADGEAFVAIDDAEGDWMAS